MNRRQNDNLPSSRIARWLDDNENGTTALLAVIAVVMLCVLYWRTAP